MGYTTSILRYPGGKTRFAPFIEQAIGLNLGKLDLFVEPFCGGAGVAICLLESQVVGEVALNDSDPLVAALWRTVFSDQAQWLADQVLTMPITVEEWKRQKALDPSTQEQAALKALFLNRTSFNGILHKSGPIGGWGQNKRTLDVRFQREKLARRILELSQMRQQVVKVECENWKAFVARFRRRSSTLVYLDPPYFHKAEQLYGHFFNLKQHQDLRRYLGSLDVPWLLSYDDAPEVRALYADAQFTARVIDATYSAHPMGGASFVGKELFFSNMPHLPLPQPTSATHVGLSVRPFQNSDPVGSQASKVPWTSVVPPG